MSTTSFCTVPDLLCLLHLPLTDLDLFVHYCPLLDRDLLRGHRNGHRLTLVANGAIGWPAIDGVPLDGDFFVCHRHVDRPLLARHLGAHTHLVGLDRLLAGGQLFLTQLDRCTGLFRRVDPAAPWCPVCSPNRCCSWFVVVSSTLSFFAMGSFSFTEWTAPREGGLSAPRTRRCLNVGATSCAKPRAPSCSGRAPASSARAPGGRAPCPSRCRQPRGAPLTGGGAWPPRDGAQPRTDGAGGCVLRWHGALLADGRLARPVPLDVASGPA